MNEDSAFGDVGFCIDDTANNFFAITFTPDFSNAYCYSTNGPSPLKATADPAETATIDDLCN
jgi:hypothetical protein